jgi:hypothetical protein
MEDKEKKAVEDAVKKQLEAATKARLEGMGVVRPVPSVGIGGYVPGVPAFGPVPYGYEQIPRPSRPYIMTVELLEDGMVLRYAYPVKKTVTVAGRANFGITNDPAVKLFFEGLAEAIDGGGEDWNEDERKGKIGKIFEKMQAMSAPRKVEKYFYETRSSICKNAVEIENATKAAREAAKLIKELQDNGEVIQHGGHPAPPLSQCFGDVVQGEAYIGGSDYSLGA